MEPGNLLIAHRTKNICQMEFEFFTYGENKDMKRNNLFATIFMLVAVSTSTSHALQVCNDPASCTLATEVATASIQEFNSPTTIVAEQTPTSVWSSQPQVYGNQGVYTSTPVPQQSQSPSDVQAVQSGFMPEAYPSTSQPVIYNNGPIVQNQYCSTPIVSNQVYQPMNQYPVAQGCCNQIHYGQPQFGQPVIQQPTYQQQIVQPQVIQSPYAQPAFIQPAQPASCQSCVQSYPQYSQPVQYSQPCLLYTSPSPRDLSTSRMPSSA